MERRQRILIVDDEEIIRDILFDLFRDEGFDALVARDAQEAIRMAPQADCIILDRKLSGETDDEGADVLKRLWEDERFATPIIIFSGYIYSSTVDESLARIERMFGKGRTIAASLPKSGGFRNLVSAVNNCLIKREP